MAKRFTDSEKWRKDWFINLTPIEKVFWTYLCDTCSNAGIWNVSWKAAEFHVGARLDRPKIEAKFSKQFLALDNGKRWFIIDFITFQYKHLLPTNPAHKGVIEELRKHGLIDEDYSVVLPGRSFKGASKRLGRSLEGLKDKDKDKAKAKALATEKDIPECFR